MDKRWAGVGRLLGIGWYIVACIVLGALGGHWIGQKLGGVGYEVALTVVGLILGLLLAFIGVYRIIKPIINYDKDKGNN